MTVNARPATIARFERMGDTESVDALKTVRLPRGLAIDDSRHSYLRGHGARADVS